MEERRKTVTVLFCDLSGSTALGERLDPESLRHVLSRYFETARAVIDSHGGTVEKFIGDAVMAVFGVPVVHEDDALRCVRAAAGLRAALVGVNEGLRRDYGIELVLRMGLNTGEVVVTGTAERLATGDAVNVAARLEQAAGDGEILLSGATLALVRDAVQVETISPLELKGKAKPVDAFRLLDVSATGAGVARESQSTMIGRQREVSGLRYAYEQAVAASSCQLFTVLGAAGVGKSRLVYEFIQGLSTATVARGNCLAYGDGVTYWPVAQVVRQIVGADLDQQQERLGLSGTALTAIRSVLGDDTFGAPDEIAWGVRELFQAEAETRPLVVVFDDLQWGAETFLDLVEHIADLSRDSPILLLCMGRPELLDRRPTWGGGKPNSTTALLERLSVDETHLMLDSLSTNTRIDGRFREQILETAEGNPFFIEQMVALAEESDATELMVPSTIQALLGARLDQLEDSERIVCERASVEGRDFHLAALGALLPDETDLAGQVTSLVRKELVRPYRPLLKGEQGFRFRHQLIREAAYERLPKTVRADLHEQLAAWLDQNARTLVELDELVGYHLARSFDYRSELGPLDSEAIELGKHAAVRLAAAGRHALARGDREASRELLERAAEVVPSESLERARLLPDLSMALASVQGAGVAAAIAAEAVELARQLGEPLCEWDARIALLHHEINAVAGDRTFAEFRRETDRVVEELEATGNDLLLARALLLKAYIFQDQATVSRAAAERAKMHALRAGARREIAEATVVILKAVSWGRAPVREGILLCEEVLAEPSLTGSLEADVLRELCVLRALDGDVESGRGLHLRARTRLEEIGATHRLHLLAFERFWLEWSAGDAAAAEQDLRATDQALERLGDSGHASTAAAYLAQISYERGHSNEALAWAERAEQFGADDDLETVVPALGARAKVAARRGDLDLATKLATRGVELIRANAEDPLVEAMALFDLAEVHGLAGREASREEALTEALVLLEEKGARSLVARAREKLGGAQPHA